jgi:hypothetical protein
MAEPKIYKKNYVSPGCVLSISSGSATGVKLYDRDIASKWISSGANNDATTVTIQVDFYEGLVAIQRTIDTLILINHNLKNWLYDYWDGSAWQNLYTNAADAATTRVVSHTQVTTYKVRITVTATQSTNAEKFIGEMVSTLLQLDIGQDFASYKPGYRSKMKELMLGDGSITRVFIRPTPNRVQKYGARATLKYISDATVATFYSIKESGDPFLWYPESTRRPTEIFYCHWANDWDAQYSSGFKGSGWDINLDLKEV